MDTNLTSDLPDLNLTPPTNASSPDDIGLGRTDIIYITCEAVIGLANLLGNGVVLGAILTNRRLHTATNVFIGNLAAADVVVGALVAPCAAVTYIEMTFDFYICVLINSLILMFTNVSILMLLSVACERFFAIRFPFLYQRVINVRSALYINLATWLLGLALGLVPMYGWNQGTEGYRGSCSFVNVISMSYMVYFQFFSLVVAPLFLMMLIYIYILHVVMKHQRQTKALHAR